MDLARRPFSPTADVQQIASESPYSACARIGSEKSTPLPIHQTREPSRDPRKRRRRNVPIHRARELSGLRARSTKARLSLAARSLACARRRSAWEGWSELDPLSLSAGARARASGGWSAVAAAAACTSRRKAVSVDASQSADVHRGGYTLHRCHRIQIYIYIHTYNRTYINALVKVDASDIARARERGRVRWTRAAASSRGPRGASTQGVTRTHRGRERECEKDSQRVQVNAHAQTHAHHKVDLFSLLFFSPCFSPRCKVQSSDEEGTHGASCIQRGPICERESR